MKPKVPAADDGNLALEYGIFFEDSPREATASPEFVAAMQALSPKHAEFVRQYLQTADGTNSARAAGYAHAFAAVEACRLLKRPDVRAALDAARTTLAEGAIYDLQRAMSETLAGIKFAIQTGNANALARLVELRSRLHGLLVEKIDLTAHLPDVREAIEMARARSLPITYDALALKEQHNA